MNFLKGVILLQMPFLLLIPLVSAEIQITLPGNNLYNLGDRVLPEISIKEGESHYGFFKVHIFCDNYKLQYYTIPLSVEAGFRAQIVVPELQLTNSMKGKCSLRADYDATDGTRIDSSSSEYFFVEDELNISVSQDLEVKPGESLDIFVEVRKYNNQFLPKGEAAVTFNNNEEKTAIGFGVLKYTLHVDKNIEAGNIPLYISAKDQFGNYADETFAIRVPSIPTRIENLLDSKLLMPNDKGRAKITLYDHTDKVINGSVINAKTLDPEKNIIAEKKVENQAYFEFQLNPSQAPGEYFLLSSFENIKEQSSFTVEAVEKIVMSQENGIVTVKNIGNVQYNDEVTIVAESEDNKYLINKKIKLEPGETIVIDISKEVPQGTYDIILPEEKAEAAEQKTAASNESEAVEEVAENVFQDVPIEDNRNVLKKTADGMSAVTGAVVGAAGYIASRPLLASITLVLIILAVVLHYSWGFIKGKVKGENSGKTDHLFNDFNYKKNEDNKPGN